MVTSSCPVGFCRVSTIQKSQAHSDDGVAHAEGEVVGRISCDYMVTLGHAVIGSYQRFFRNFGCF